MKFWPFKERSIKTSIGQFIFSPTQKTAIDNLTAYAEEGYSMNPTAFACIDLTSKCFARVPLRVKERGEFLESHPLIDLLKRPNKDEGGVEHRIAACSWLLMAGNCFTQKLMIGKVPSELYLWQPYEFSIHRAIGNPLPYQYVYAENSKNRRVFPVDQVTGKSDIMHWRTFNPSPLNGEFGMSPLKACALSVDSANNARQWNYSALKNGGSANIIVTTEQEVTPKQKQAYERELQENWMGPKNANKIHFMGSSTDVHQISMNPQEMEWLGGLNLSAQEICSCFGVPTQLLGIEGSQTYANYEEAKLAFFVQTVVPLLDLYVSELNRWIAPDFGEGIEVCYSKDDIDALEPMRREKRAELLATDVLTINEKRILLGYDERPEEEANQLFIQPNDIALGDEFYDDSEDSET